MVKAAKLAGLMPRGDDWDAAAAESIGAFMMDVGGMLFACKRPRCVFGMCYASGTMMAAKVMT